MMPGTSSTRSAASATGARCARARQRRERAILGGAEVGQQFAPALPAREPQPDLFIAPREAVVRRDVIER